MNYSMASGRNVRIIQIMQELEAWLGTECSGLMVAINYSLALVMISSPWALCRGGQILVFSCLKHLKPQDWSKELSQLRTVMNYSMASGRNVRIIQIMQELEAWLGTECSGLMVAINYSLTLVSQIVSWRGDLLRRCGDVESNPGPPCDRENGEGKEGTLEPPIEDEDPWLVRLNEPFDASLGCVRWEGITIENYQQNKLHFNTVLANRRFKNELTKRLSNALYYCNCERYSDSPNGLDCYKGLAELFCRTPAVCNDVIHMFNQVLKGEKCFICLQNSKGDRLSLVPGASCSDLCEQALLEKFQECEGNYHMFKIHLLRGWNLLYLNKTSFPFSCKIHATCKVCLINSVDYESLKAQLGNKKVNSLKARKSRARRLQQTVKRMPENMADVMDEINTGSKCATCMTELSFDPEGIILNEGISLNFCSINCENRARINLKYNFHENRNMIIFTAIASYYHLHMDYYKLSLHRQGHQASDEFQKAKNSNKTNNFRVEIKESSAYIVSFNCNGAKNIYKVKEYCKDKRPAVMGLQEIRTDSKNKLKKRLYVPGYETISGSMDTAILVREDIKISESGYMECMKDLPHEFVQLDTPNGKYRVVNIYCRDGQLTYTQLSMLENFGNRTFCIGDFNAKHREFLTHTQAVDSNSNGDTLFGYLYGDNAFEQESKLHCHNINSPNVYTRALDDRWVQLDLIFSHPDIIDSVDRFVYEDSLLSDHKAVAVYCPDIFRPKEKYIYYDQVIDWDTYNEIKFRSESKEAIMKLRNSQEWPSLTLNDKAVRIQDIIKTCVKDSTQKKKQSTRKRTLPPPLLELIKDRRKNRILLNTILSETNKREELRMGLKLGPGKSLVWTKEELEAHKKEEASYRAKVVEVSKEINEAFRELKTGRWNEALTGLSQLDPKKACKEFWRTITKLSGKGKKSEVPNYITYKGITSVGHKEIAETFANFYEDTYKPQEDSAFDQEMIREINGQADVIKRIWSLPEVLNEDREVQMTVKDTVLRKGVRASLEGGAKPPRPTKSMKKNNTQLIDRKLYLGKKKPIPNIVPLNLQIRKNLVDIHNTDRLKRLKRETIAEFEMAELLVVLGNTKRKAPGNDGIFINQMKDLHASSKKIVLELYNEIWTGGAYPEVWRKAILVPIMKKGKVAGDPLSYRPISLLPIMGKVLESLVHPRLEKYFMERRLIPDFQTGFRKRHSTSINLRRLFSNSYFQSTVGVQKRPTVSIFFDAKKAFDTVWHEGLLVKLAKDGVPAQIIRFVGSWLLERELKVRIGKEYSRNIALRSGVPQGSVISPLLWNYWLGDCPAVKSPHAFSALYADDVALWASHPSYRTLIKIINAEIKNLVEWIRSKRLIFTQDKTMAMVTHTDRQVRNKVKALQLFMDEERQEKIEWKSQAVLLGILFHETGSFAPHIQNKVRLAAARVRSLWRFNKVVEGKKLYNVYKAAIEPILTYGTEVFYESISEILAKKLLSVEFSAIRCCFGLRKETSKVDMLEYFNDSSIMTRIDNRRQRFLEANLGQHLIEFNETSPFSQGRRHRTYKMYVPPRAPRDWRRIFYVHKPRVFFSDLSEQNIKECRTHHEYSLDKVIEIIGPHIDVRRQREWELNREKDILSCETRGIPSYDMMNSMLECSPEQEPLIRLEENSSEPNFRLRVPSRWELKALVSFREDEVPKDYYISGVIGQGMNDIPEPYLPGDFLDIFSQGPEEGHAPELSGADHRMVLRNIEEAGRNVPEDLRLSGDRETWIEQIEKEDGREVRNKVLISEPPLPTESEMENYDQRLEHGENVEYLAAGLIGHQLFLEISDHGLEPTPGGSNMTKGTEAGNKVELGEESLEIDILQPNYVQLSNYWEEDRNRNQTPQSRDEADLEATLLGYDLIQEISGIDRNLRNKHREQGLGPEEDSDLDFDYGQDYHLGEIGNRSFCDKHGIWANGPQRFPSPRQERDLQPPRQEKLQDRARKEVNLGLHGWAEQAWEAYKRNASANIWGFEEESLEPEENEIRIKTPDQQDTLHPLYGEEREGQHRSATASPTWSDLDKCFENAYWEDEGEISEAQEYARSQVMAKEKGRGSQEGEPCIGPRPCFITGLFQDQDLREERIAKEGGLTFSHLPEGDIEVQENTRETTIPARYPPMSATTVDWSVKYRPENLWRGGSSSQEGGSHPHSGDKPEKAGPNEQLRLKLSKGRYTKKRKPRRRGRNKTQKNCDLTLSVPPGQEVQDEEASPCRVGNGSTRATRAEEQEEAEEEPGSRTTPGDETTTTRMTEKKTGSRRRRTVAIIRGGRLLPEEVTPARGRRTQKSLFHPRRDEIITHEMADPNRTNSGYRAQEALVANARTSGVFWRNSGIRDNRQFPGTAKKTLQDRASNTSSPWERDKTDVGSQDLPQWPGVSTLDVDPG